MADTPKTAWEYLVAPLSGEWRSREEARVLLDAWLSQEGRTGAPAITVSRRPVAEATPVGWVPKRVSLGTSCAECGHTLNWHRNDVGCPGLRCTCEGFVPLDPQGS